MYLPKKLLKMFKTELKRLKKITYLLIQIKKIALFTFTNNLKIKSKIQNVLKKTSNMIIFLLVMDFLGKYNKIN